MNIVCKQLLSLCIILSIIFLIVVSIEKKNIPSRPEDPFAGLQSRDFTEAKEFWSQRIDEIGGSGAYAEFKEAYKNEDYGKQHTLAHIFGELLYKKEGIDAVAVCDSSFGFGCYHSLFGFAILEEGLSVIYKLDKACVETLGLKALGCPHGIGHGILSYLGYDHFEEALNECAKLSWKGPIGGCTSGVFMEFNFRTMENPLEVNPRKREGVSVYYPCTNVTEKFREACYFEQPAWWKVVYTADTYGYEEVGELCAGVEGLTEEREACFRGVGNVIAGFGRYDIGQIIQFCTHMPNQRGKVLCRQGAAWIVSSQPAFKDVWEYICKDLEDEDLKVCLSGKQLI